MIQLKINPIGNSLGVVLPKEALVKLGAGKGDSLYLTEMPGGEFKLTALNEEVAEEIRLGEAFMDRYRDTFRALAK
ncbi:MAG TPA: AbrB/MazE/SpoVT family DNA-binding domain-containing protein [Caulobacteraceae bacterium]|nr:AbrB/MazE/SpoVT family DNA-binding domain-containing protein [Caulobacteraceae bacterium]